VVRVVPVGRGRSLARRPPLAGGGAVVTRRPRRLVVAVLLAVAAWNGGRAAWIAAKAGLAQRLVRASWSRVRGGEANARPWPWADTRPVARLVVPGQQVELFVLAGASGRTMAFGPGHVDGTALPGERGNAVLSGHRDTHFAFLRRVREGDAILVERPDGRLVRYAVSGARVVDRGANWVVAEDPDDTRLTLVTCWPFDALRPGGPLRYVVTARLAPVSGSLTHPPPGEGRGAAALLARDTGDTDETLPRPEPAGGRAVRLGAVVRRLPAGRPADPERARHGHAALVAAARAFGPARSGRGEGRGRDPRRGEAPGDEVAGRQGRGAGPEGELRRRA